MANALFRWTLTNLSDNSTDVLTKDPIGWDESTFTIKRDAFYKGVIQDYTVQLKFHCEGGGKQFIDNVYNTEDIDGRIQILIEYRCDPLSDEFATLYTGIINLASYAIDGTYTMCNIERGGFATKLKSRDEINVNLEALRSVGDVGISAATVNTLDLEGQEIYLRNESDFSGTYAHTITVPSAASVVMTGFAMPSISTISAELNQYNGLFEFNDMALNGPTTTDSFLPAVFEAIDPNVEWPATLDYAFSFDGVFSDILSSGQTRTNTKHSFSLAWGPEFGNQTGAVTLYSSGGYTTSLATYTDAFAVATSGSITLNYGDKVWLYWYEKTTITTGPYSDDQVFDYDYTQFNFLLDIYSNFSDSACKSFLIHEALGQTIDSLVDDDDSLYSEYYGRENSDKRTYPANGCGSFLAVTNGKSIRAFPDVPVFCNLKEIYQSLDALHNIGLGIEADPADATRDIVRVEPITYFFDALTTILTLPNVSDVTTRNDNTKYINTVNIGYDKWETEYRGGLDEPCARHEYSTLIATVKNILNKLSKYIASGYAIEFARRKNYDRFPTEDYRTDNDNFFFAINRGVDGSGVPNQLTHPEKRPDGFDSATGSVSDIDKMFNLRLTPKHMLLSHMKTVVSALQIIQGEIHFVRGDGNINVSTNMINTTCPESYSGQGLAESASLDFDDANVTGIDPLTSTEIYSFKHPLTYAQFVSVRANPYGQIAFTDYTGATKSGFILNMEFELKTGITSFELIKA